MTPTQAEAEAAAKEILGNSGGGEVLIHGRDGKIRDKDTVALGSLELVDAVLGHGKGPALSQQFVQVDTVFRGAVAQSGE